MTPRLKAILEALFVALIWATSWVIIKISLKDISPLLFAGWRYFLAGIILLVVWFLSPERKLFSSIDGKSWGKIVLLGIFYYAITQGSQFIGLKALPAVTVNLILGLTTIVVAFLGTIFLREQLSLAQWLGIILTMLGAYIYFFPIQFMASQWTGLVIVFIGMAACSIGSLISRDMNRSKVLPPLTLTTWSLLLGGILMLAGGIVSEGLQPVSLNTWLVILWLATVNTAFAFTLWNRAMQILTAAESNAINNTLLVQVPILAVIFLGETITLRQLAGMGLIVVGVVMVQVFRKKLGIIPGS
jgi:drug/metabolite transporter (DMT)-like permease